MKLNPTPSTALLYLTLSALAVCATTLVPTGPASAASLRSGNPIFDGWYADPEAALFGNQYWIYPTYSAPYNQQVFFDAFASPDLVHWTKHSLILSTNEVTWAR